MTLVPVVHHNRDLRAQLRRGLPRRQGIRVVSCTSVDRVASLLGSQLVDGVVVDVRAGWARPTFEMAHAFPRIPFFAFSAFRPADGALLAACRRAPLSGILVEGVDDAAAGRLIGPHLASRKRREALADAPRLLRLIEPLQLQAWAVVLDRAEQPMTTGDVAVTLRKTREHLSREFAAGGAPNLKRVIDLARAALASDLLGNPGYTVRTVSDLLGYSSPSHFAGSARRVAGVTPRELARLGPRGVLQRFVLGRTRSRV